MDVQICVVMLLLSQSAVHGNLTPVSEDRLSHAETALGQVLKENGALESRLVQLQAQLNDQQQERLELTEKVSELEVVVERQKDEIAALEENMANFKFSKDHQGQTTPATVQKRQLTAAWVGFTAVISPADLTNLNSGQPIVFDKVITNMASAYNATSGVFTAPTKGLYVFNMAILVEPGEDEYLQFVKDGAHVMYNYGHARGSLHDISSSRTVVLQLDSGNQVWIRTAPNSHHGSGNLHGNGFSTFSGWLQAVIEDASTVVGK